MKKKEEIIVYQNTDPLLVSKQGIFPGVSLQPNNDLLIIFSIINYIRCATDVKK